MRKATTLAVALCCAWPAFAQDPVEGLAGGPPRSPYAEALQGRAEPPPYTLLLGRHDPANRINIAMLAEGYTEAEREAFLRDAEKATRGLFSDAPFDEYRTHFNVYAVFVPSAQSGIDLPTRFSVGQDDPAANPYIDRDTAFDTRLSHTCDCEGERTRGFARWLEDTPLGFLQSLGQLLMSSDYRTLNANRDRVRREKARAPAADYVFVLANTHQHAGTKWSHAMVVGARQLGLSGIMAHELGHALGNLADEYTSPDSRQWRSVEREPREPNVSLESDPARVKWRHWIGEGALEAPVEGGQYRTKGIWRPRKRCRMNTSFRPFCEVCREALVLRIRDKVDPIDRVTPASQAFEWGPTDARSFRVDLVALEGLQIEWYLDDRKIGEGSTLRLAWSQLRRSRSLLQLRVRDTTPWVRLERNSLTGQRQWIIVDRTRAPLTPIPPTRPAVDRAGIRDKLREAMDRRP